MYENGKILEGFRLSEILGKIPKCLDKDGHLLSKKLAKHSEKIFRTECKRCGLDFYVKIPKWQQERIEKKNEVSVLDIVRSNPLRVAYFKDEKDLIQEALNEVKDILTELEILERKKRIIVF